MNLLSAAVFTISSASIFLAPSSAQAELVEPRVLSLYEQGTMIRAVYGSYPRMTDRYDIVDEIRLPDGRKDYQQIQRNREGLRKAADRMNAIVRELRTLSGGRFYAEALVTGQDPAKLRAVYEIAVQGAYEGRINPLTGGTFVHPRAAEIMSQLSSIESRYGGEPKTDVTYSWANSQNRAIIKKETAEYADLLAELRELPQGAELAKARVRIPNLQKRLETKMPARFAHQTIYEPVALPAAIDPRFSNFQSTLPMTGFSLTSPPWLTSTSHPVLRPESLIPATPQSTDPLQRSAIYTGMLTDFARITAPSIPQQSSMKKADPYRVQMELAVVFATYVAPFQTLLGFPNWDGSKEFRQSVRSSLAASGNSDVWELASREWLASTGKTMYEAMAAHPREVATLLIGQSTGFSSLPWGGIEELRLAQETLYRADSNAPRFLTTYGSYLLRAMYSPEARAHYPFPWFIDGTTGTPARNYAEFGPTLVRGANELVDNLDGFLKRERALNVPMKGGKCPALFISN